MEKWVAALPQGFCPILSQRERRDGARRAPPNGGVTSQDATAVGSGRPGAMLAPDASVGKAEKQLYQGVLDIPNNELIIVFPENYAII